MTTHSALLSVSAPNGGPVPRCGWQSGTIAVAWERRFIDCPMCLLELDNIPVVPVTEAHFMRTPRRPDYVPEGHVYTSSEFRTRRRLNLLQVIILWIMAFLVVATGILIYGRWTDNVGVEPAPVILVTPTTYAPPPS